MFIKIRKKLWLPIKFVLTRLRIRRSYKLKSRKEIQEKIEEENKKLLTAKRVRDGKLTYIQEGKVEILNWLTK